MQPIRHCLLAALLCLGLLQPARAGDPAELRLGYQKASISLVLAKEHGLLEKRFPQTRIKWIEFPAGPQMLEAMNIGALDIGSTGDIPPLFAQAAGADLLYIGTEPAKPSLEVILVGKDSAFRSVADLKGRRVALQKGSSAHNVLLRALRREGLSFADIQPVYLSPADARAAFEFGSVDAWVIWEPFSSLIRLDGKARVLVDGEGLGLSGPFYLAARPFAEAHPQFIDQLFAVLTEAEALTRSQPEDSVKRLARYMGLPPEVIAAYLNSRPPSPILPITPEIIRAQQATADLFYEQRLLPKRLDVSEAFWKH
jgi:sulfonate transport system substrate-binding protein